MFEKRITDDVKSFLKPFLKEGCVCVDLTAGNGNDTLFLAEEVGQAGKVYAFDIQELAINNTKVLLEGKGVLDRVELILDGHEKVLAYVDEEVQVAMCNLGYLPGGDRTLITKKNTSIEGIKGVLERLAINGVLSIVVYYGHDGGEEEREAVEEFLEGLDDKAFQVVSFSYVNRKNKPPIIYLIHKLI